MPLCMRYGDGMGNGYGEKGKPCIILEGNMAEAWVCCGMDEPKLDLSMLDMSESSLEPRDVIDEDEDDGILKYC